MTDAEPPRTWPLLVASMRAYLVAAALVAVNVVVIGLLVDGAILSVVAGTVAVTLLLGGGLLPFKWLAARATLRRAGTGSTSRRNALLLGPIAFAALSGLLPVIHLMWPLVVGFADEYVAWNRLVNAASTSGTEASMGR